MLDIPCGNCAEKFAATNQMVAPGGLILALSGKHLLDSALTNIHLLDSALSNMHLLATRLKNYAINCQHFLCTPSPTVYYLLGTK